MRARAVLSVALLKALLELELDLNLVQTVMVLGLNLVQTVMVLGLNPV